MDSLRKPVLQSLSPHSRSNIQRKSLLYSETSSTAIIPNTARITNNLKNNNDQSDRLKRNPKDSPQRNENIRNSYLQERIRETSPNVYLSRKIFETPPGFHKQSFQINQESLTSDKEDMIQQHTTQASLYRKHAASSFLQLTHSKEGALITRDSQKDIKRDLFSSLELEKGMSTHENNKSPQCSFVKVSAKDYMLSEEQHLESNQQSQRSDSPSLSKERKSDSHQQEIVQSSRNILKSNQNLKIHKRGGNTLFSSFAYRSMHEQKTLSQLYNITSHRDHHNNSKYLENYDLKKSLLMQDTSHNQQKLASNEDNKCNHASSPTGSLTRNVKLYSTKQSQKLYDKKQQIQNPSTTADNIRQSKQAFPISVSSQNHPSLSLSNTNTMLLSNNSSAKQISIMQVEQTELQQMPKPFGKATPQKLEGTELQQEMTKTNGKLFKVLEDYKRELKSMAKEILMLKKKNLELEGKLQTQGVGASKNATKVLPTKGSQSKVNERSKSKFL